MLRLNNGRPVLREQAAQDGTVAALFVFAVAADREVGLCRELREQAQEMRLVWRRHLTPVADFEPGPFAG